MRLTRKGSEHRGRTPPLARILVLLGALALLVAAAITAVPAWLGPQAEAQARAGAQSAARLGAERLAERVDERLSLIARMPDAAALQAAFPEAVRIRSIPPDGLTPAPRAEPPVGYALVKQASRALEDGTASAEVHLPGGPDAQLNLIAPRQDGAWLVTLPTSVLGEWLGSATPGHTRSLERGGTTLASHGRADGPGATSPVAGTGWQLRIQAPQPQVPLRDATMLIAGLSVLGVALVGAGLWLRQRTPQPLPADASSETTTPPGAEAPPAAVDITPADGEGLLVEEPPLDEPPLEQPAEEDAPPASGPRDLPPLEFVDPNGADADATAAETVTEETLTLEDDDGLEIVDEPESREPAAKRHSVDPSILRAYDIRGIVGETLTAATLERLGRAFGHTAAEQGHDSVVVACDGRHSSPELASALIEGITGTGCDVIDIGEAPTPLLYFATHLLGTGAGAVVTASHNPPAYNGLKAVLGGEALSTDAIQALGARAERDEPADGGGSVSRRDVVLDYIDAVASDITLHRPLRVAIDCGNGVAGAVAPALFRALGNEVVELFCDVDGDFPNHHPDPSVPDNLAALVERVRAGEADVGLAFDGDGDRLGVVDSEGNIIWPDRLLMLFAQDVLARLPGSDIIFDVKCTRHLAEIITVNAGVPVMWRTGHSLIKRRRAETNAPLAGEMSGHIVFGDRWFGVDDALYAGARLLELLSFEGGRTSADVFAALPEGHSTPEIRVNLAAEGESTAIMERLLAQVDELPEAARVTTLDGLRIDYPDGWGLVRASNTQPSLVLRFEGDDADALERVRAHFRDQLAAAAPGLELPF
ncbi:phosphomannomutase/phosphoglucomutase [Arhodomonas sp. AD133]|uniref:phosphomannomutase/phosphoglucomutase n=1 Tax=Arhodomonas sp. AD133 TaxID=3415009 RepID=UPI003EC01538